MKNLKGRIILFVFISWHIVLGVRHATAEDFFFEKKSQTFINGELAESPKIVKVWMKEDRIRYESDHEEGKYFLILMGKGKTYELDKIQKIFKETSNEMAKLKEMKENTIVISKRTGQKKKIGKWNCYEIILDTKIQGQKMKATCWLTEDIQISRKVMEKIAKFTQMKLMEELVKFPGYPVEMTMESVLQGKRVKVISTLTKISKKPLEAKFFKIPFDYSKVKAQLEERGSHK